MYAGLPIFKPAIPAEIISFFLVSLMKLAANTSPKLNVFVITDSSETFVISNGAFPERVQLLSVSFDSEINSGMEGVLWKIE